MAYKPLTLEEALQEQLQDPEFRKEWEATEEEYQFAKAMLEARLSHSLTQKQLSELTGISQADISRLETGTAHPSFKTMKKIAHGLGMHLHFTFVPNE